MTINATVKRYGISPGEEEAQFQAFMAANQTEEELAPLYDNSVRDFSADSIFKGKVLRVVGNDVVVDIGYKSEGLLPVDHFEDPDHINPGDEIEVLLESVEDESGLVVLSKRKADRIRGWEKVISTYHEGDTVRGKITRKIKGGLLVDIGVPVFLPASQVGIRRVGDIGSFIGREVQAKIIKIDEARMNIVVSRRKLLEEQRETSKKELLGRLKVGDVVEGVVKNIADFGAFVDLGGIDGLLHITDMDWSRITHPSERVNVEDRIKVKVLKIDPERERISLGLKQLAESPWKDIGVKYPIGTKHKGSVVNVLSYGAFVRLEPGVEGLVHISEMSWIKRLNHPSEMVSSGDELDVVVLDINKEKQEISLGMKQAEINPWTTVHVNYPPGTVIEGRVRNLTTYGAFIEIEEGIDGLLHVSDMSWTRKIVHPSEMLKKADAVTCIVLSVDQEKKRIALGMKQLEEDPWDHKIPMRYAPGSVVKGKVTKVTNFGVFVQLEDDLEGLLHISELATHKVDNPEEILGQGDVADLKVIKIDQADRKIGLSLRKLIEDGYDPQIKRADPEEAARLKQAQAEAEARAARGYADEDEAATGDGAPAADGDATPAAGGGAAPAADRDGAPPDGDGAKA